MANLFASLLAKFVAPEEHTLGKALAAAYAADKTPVIAALGADEAKAAAALEADAQVWITAAFNAVPDGALLLPILGGAANAEADALITKGVAAAGGYTPLVEAYADKVVAAVVAQLEAA